MAAYKILVASNTSNVYTLSFEPDSASLKIISETEIGPQPSWIDFVSGLSDRRVIGGVHGKDGGVFIAQVDENTGRLDVLARANTGGGPCHVKAVGKGREIVAAHYTAGTVGIVSLLPSSPHLDTTSLKVLKLDGPPGPNQERQDQPHAHEIYELLGSEELLVPDLGGDRVYRLRRSSETGHWALYSFISYPAGYGPRNAAVYNGILYTLQELKPSVAFCELPSGPETTSVASEKVVPTTFEVQPPAVLGALILIPELNETYAVPYIYTSNRDIPSDAGDTIAIMTTAPDVKLIAEVSTGLRHVRGMQFGGPGNKWLIAGGANIWNAASGGGVKIFERVDGGKGLKEIAYLEDDIRPTGFLWL